MNDYYGYDPSGEQDEPSFDQRDVEIRKLVRQEIARNYKPPRSFLKNLLLVILGAVLGLALFLALVYSQKKFLPFMESEKGQETIQEEVSISLKEEGVTVENAVAKKAIPSIVGITSTRMKYSENPFLYGIPQYMESVGSGVIISKDGHILTNAHVVDNGKAESLKVLFSNDQEKEAKLLWSDSTLDLAVIKVEAENLPAINLGDSSKVQVGDKAIAIGNPLGLDLQSTLTSGFISGLNRSITLQDGNVMDGLIQTDAAINAGNSGGALLNAKGELIAINTAKPQVADGIGFAIPIDAVKPIIERITETGSFEPVYLGITGYNVSLARKLGMESLPVQYGVLVREVVADSPAAKLGVLPGDIIVSLDDKKIESMNGLKTMLIQYKNGDSIELGYYHKDELMKGKITFEAVDFES